MHYSIIIPVYNEFRHLPFLLDNIKKYSYNNEIVIVNDGSSDGSEEYLKKSKFILLINLKNNSGKAFAIKKGIEVCSFKKIIIFDGDLEISPNQLYKLMILNRNNNIISVFGNRQLKPQSCLDYWNIGNFFFSYLFNLFFKTSLNDVLCCAKSFYREDIDLKMIKSKGFDIDLEIAALLSINSKIFEVNLDYKRRTKKEGKKLTVFSGFIIFYRLFIIFIDHSLFVPFKRIFDNHYKR